jgi:hypothetical protein
MFAVVNLTVPFTHDQTNQLPDFEPPEFSSNGLMRFSRAQIIGALVVLLIIWLVVILRLLSSHA